MRKSSDTSINSKEVFSVISLKCHYWPKITATSFWLPTVTQDCQLLIKRQMFSLGTPLDMFRLFFVQSMSKSVFCWIHLIRLELWKKINGFKIKFNISVKWCHGNITLKLTSSQQQWLSEYWKKSRLYIIS